MRESEKNTTHVWSEADWRRFGLSPDTPARLLEALRTAGAPPESRVTIHVAPGRIEVLGKHTDYAGGDSLVCAVERGFVVAAVADPRSGVRVIDLGRGEQVLIGEVGGPAWAIYPTSVVERVVAAFGPFSSGATLACISSLPPDAGLSSSSAFIVGCYRALRSVWRFDESPIYKAVIAGEADFLGHIENGQPYRGLAGGAGVGTSGGSQDHAAIVDSRAGAITRFRYAPMARVETIPLSEDVVFVVGISGVAAPKTGAARDAYNRASALARDVVEMVRKEHPDAGPRLRDLVETFQPAALEQALLPRPDLLARYRHFAAEHGQLVSAAAGALRQSDWQALGEVVDLSQALAESLLRNQIPETITLARLARRHGALAASSFGAGFGGAVWALCPASDAEAFAAHWLEAYRTVYPQHINAHAFITRPGPPAGELYLGVAS